MSDSHLCPACKQLTTGTLRPVVLQDTRSSPEDDFKLLVFLRDEDSNPMSARELELRKTVTTPRTLVDMRARFVDESQDSASLLWWHSSFGDLRSRAERRECRLCLLIADEISNWAQLSEISSGPQVSDQSYILLSIYLNPRSDSGMRIWQVREARCRSLATLELDSRNRDIGTIAEGSSFISHNNRMSGINTQTMRRIRSWISSCKCGMSSDEDMVNTQETLRLPARLVEIEGNPKGLTARLIETHTLPTSKITYATLSHCWGPSGMKVRLNSGNIGDWLKAIPIDQLSLTFREAICFVNALKISYLWIDALCIIQGQDTIAKSDWEKEAPFMQSIYANGKVNLAASASTSGEGGLFVQNYAVPCTIAFWFKSRQNLNGVRTLYPQLILWSDIDSAPLNNRGWVFQEQLLSHRTIHFTSRQLYWDCSTRIDSECGFTGSSPSQIGFWGHQRFPRGNWPPWTEIVQTFTRKRLSVPTDRLVAIAGVADAFALQNKVPPQEYVAGLWRQGMLDQLCWESDDDIESKPLDIAPSWSWASQKSAIYYRYMRINPACSVLQADHHPMQHKRSHSGAPHKGVLRLRAPLVEVTKVSESHYYLRHREKQEIRLVHLLRETEKPNVQDNWAAEADLYLAPLAYGERRIHFMCLRTVKEHKGTFVRVGSVELWPEPVRGGHSGEDAGKDYKQPYFSFFDRIDPSHPLLIQGSFDLAEEYYISKYAPGIYEFDII